MIDIVCNIDKNYVEHCGVMLTSLFVHNADLNFRIHIINTGLSESDKQRLTTYVEDNQAKAFFYDVDFSVIKDFPIAEKDHLSLAAYLRLFMSKLLPTDIDKILYLDCDLLVVDSIKELWDTDLENKSVGAVEEREPYSTESPQGLKYPVEYSYFNSGVMLINLKKWREEDLYDRAMKFIASHKELLVLHDQDVLNVLLYKDRKFISIRWNVMDFFLLTRPHIQNRRKLDWKSSIQHPGIIHFTGKRKPWLRSCDSPYRAQYIKLAKQFGWHVITVRESFSYCLRKVWYGVLIFFHLRKKRTIRLGKNE
ncbi:glycosyltransferase family 8 protein [Bacteroides reticulotermitis]|uniref:glycosyltransferase family 8 protein n=1 Tax=Bacteroides reticulotermitis TaxID=1133319 RepID=UPI003A86CBF9